MFTTEFSVQFCLLDHILAKTMSRPRFDDVATTAAGLDIVGHVTPPGQPFTHGSVLQVVWTRLSLCRRPSDLFPDANTMTDTPPGSPAPVTEKNSGRGTAWVFIQMLCAFLAVSAANNKLAEGRKKAERLLHQNEVFQFQVHSKWDAKLWVDQHGNDVCGNNNHHAVAACAIRELAWEIHQSQEAVLDHHQRNIHAEIARRSDVCF